MKLMRVLMFVLGMVAGAGPAFAVDPGVARTAVEAALADGIKTFANGQVYPLEERRRLLDQILRRHSDPLLLSAEILGRFWSRISPEDRVAFSERLVRFMVSSYIGLLSGGDSGVVYRVGEGVATGDRVQIPSEIVRTQPGAVPTQVDWEVVSSAEGQPAIVGLTVDGVSLIRAMNEDFTSVLRNSGGRIEPLMEALQRKIDLNDRANAAESVTSRN